MLSWTVTFAVREDGTIDLDAPGATPQEVRSRMGDRFLPWPQEQSAAESWQEGEMHARNILGDEELLKLMAGIEWERCGRRSGTSFEREGNG